MYGPWGVWNKEKWSLIHWKSSLVSAYSEDTAIHLLSLSMSGVIVWLVALALRGRNKLYASYTNFKYKICGK